MPVGIEIRRSDNTIMIGPDTRLCKILQIGYTQGAPFGYFDVPEWNQYPGWFATMSPYNYNEGFSLPDVYIDGAGVRWSRRAGGTAPTAPMYIMWGIY